MEMSLNPAGDEGFGLILATARSGRTACLYNATDNSSNLALLHQRELIALRIVRPDWVQRLDGRSVLRIHRYGA